MQKTSRGVILDCIESVSKRVTDDCTYSGVLQLGAAILNVSEEVLDYVINQDWRKYLKMITTITDCALSQNWDEFDYYNELVNKGITEDIMNVCISNSAAEAFREYCSEHGLI